MIETQGIETVQANLSRLAEKYSKAVVDGAYAGAQLVRTDAIKSIQQQSSGAEVQRYRNNGEPYPHIVSKPGDAPNTDTGRLVGSIHVDVDARFIQVGSPLEYAQSLEYGTATMKARPWLFPALEKNRQTIRSLMKGRIDNVTRDANK